MIARRDARVLVVGLGGLGCPAILALARMGIGTLGIADDDEVSETNLHRQILYRDEDIGAHKVDAAERAIHREFTGIRVIPIRSRILPDNAIEMVRGYDVIVEGSDNFATKFLAADACRIAGVPVVHGAGVRWHGTALAVSPSGAPCYRCLFEDVPRENAPNCAEAGVMGPVVGVVGALQSQLALEILEGRARAFGSLYTFDGKTLALRRRAILRRPSCPLCGDEPSISRIEEESYADAPACDESMDSR